MKFKIFTSVLVLLFAQVCNAEEKILDQQIKACVEDVKLGLGDPNSIEVLSTEGINVDNGGFRLKLNFTAKNEMGGRVRGETICGFKNKNDIQLDAEDFPNQERRLRQRLSQLNQ